MAVYIPPEHGSYIKSTKLDPFAAISQAYQKFPPSAHNVLMGDFNAHKGQSPETRPRLVDEQLITMFEECDMDLPARSSIYPSGHPWARDLKTQMENYTIFL